MNHLVMTRQPTEPVASGQSTVRLAAQGVVVALLMFAVLLGGAPALADSSGKMPAEPDVGKATLGKQKFRSFCASCHGREAKGDGSLSNVLAVKPRDLTLLARNNGGVFPYERTFAVIDGREKVKGHGNKEMPAWGDAFGPISEDEAAVAAKIEQLVHFLWARQVK